jgi:hypothetical protein
MFSDNFCHKDVAQCKRQDTAHRVNNSRNFLFREPKSKLQESVYYNEKKTVYEIKWNLIHAIPTRDTHGRAGGSLARLLAPGLDNLK